MMHNHWTGRAKPRHKGAMLTLATLLSTLVPATAAMAGTLESVSVDGNEVSLHFSAAGGEAGALALSGPDRIAVDIAGHTPGAPVASPGGMIRSVRQGRLSGDGMRIVLDLGGAARIGPMSYSPDGCTVRFSLIPGAGGNDQASILSPVGGMPSLAMARTPQRRYQVSVPIGRARDALALPEVQGPDNAALPLVVIDAGHGGHDPGAISPDGQFHEEDVTLAIARRIRDTLLASGRVRVALTRDSDRYLVLEERYGIARRLNADLFISVHADSAENAQASGASIYTLSEVASDREAARLAARENRSNILNGIDLGGESDDVRSILIDLAQRETMNLSADFARTLQRVGGADIPFRTAAHRHAGFVVLKAPDMPSVLVETGFISNPADARRISSADGQSAIARGVREAVLTHFARRLEQSRPNPVVAAR